MLVDCEFSCKMKIKPGAYHAIVIKNRSKSLVLKFKTAQIQKEWFDKLVFMIQETAACFYDNNLLVYDSFAPQRSNQMCKWYINAWLYMEHAMKALNEAKEEIYIADWWLCPELYLKRPLSDLQHRLDQILFKKANEGVKIYILLFKEIDFLIGLVN